VDNQHADQDLYFKRPPIVPRSVKGPFRRFKTAILWLGFAVYFLLPWLPWARSDAPSQAVLFDIPGRRYYMFDLTVFPQDIFWLAILLFMAAVLLFSPPRWWAAHFADISVFRPCGPMPSSGWSI
jgi:hypothetical protein